MVWYSHVFQNFSYVDILFALLSTSKFLRVLRILLSRTNILGISIKNVHAVMFNGSRKQVLDVQVGSKLSFLAMNN